MNAQMRKFHDAAMSAHTKAKAIAAEYKDSGIPADKKEEFDLHMKEWNENHNAFVAAKNEYDQITELEKASELYTAPVGQPVHQNADLDQPKKNTNESAKARHRDAFNRFLAFGPQQGLSREEQVAYVAGPRQLLGNNPEEDLSGLLPQEQHALVGTTDSLGGFLVPDEFMDELIKELPGFTVIRPLAKVQRTSRSSATFLTVAGSGNDAYSSGVSGSFRAEGWVVGGNNIPTQDQPRFGRERVPVHIWAPDVIEITMELMDDASVNLDAEVRSLLAETRGIDEDSAFIAGTGVGQPMGLLTEVGLGNITTVQSGAANAQTYDGLVNLYTALPAQYRSRATWLMNSTTLGLIMQLDNGAGSNHIFGANTVPTEFFGRPIVVSEFMPDGDTDGNDAIIFGDFSYYAIADRMDMRIIRLTERFAPNIGLLAVARVGGQVLKTAPFRAQNVGA